MSEMTVVTQGDKMVATDTHVVMVPSPAGPVPTPTPMPFVGTLARNLSPDVFVEDLAVAVAGSVAVADTPHLPIGGTSFQRPPKNEGTVDVGSATVFANDVAIARVGDVARTCSDPDDLPAGQLVGTHTVTAG